MSQTKIFKTTLFSEVAHNEYKLDKNSGINRVTTTSSLYENSKLYCHASLPRDHVIIDTKCLTINKK